MWHDAELVVKNYKPLQLEVGMLFIQKLHQGTLKENIELFILERVPQDEEAFIQKNGYPIELYVVDGEQNILASNEEIGLWDDGGDDLYDISVEHVNTVFNDYDGCIQIDMTDISEPNDEYSEYVPTMLEGNVILRFPQEEWFEEDFLEEEEEEDELCMFCNGTGEGEVPEYTCTHCKGSGFTHKNYFEP